MFEKGRVLKRHFIDSSYIAEYLDAQRYESDIQLGIDRLFVLGFLVANKKTVRLCHLTSVPIRRRDAKAPGHIYFASADDGTIKIGWATDPAQRVAALQTSTHHALELLSTRPGTMRDEHKLHLRFNDLRIRGEWFRSTPELVAFAVGK